MLDDEDINQTYYGARYLNGVTNRFNSVDPLQGKYPGWSPYSYGGCNPLRNREVDGQFWETVLDIVAVGLSYNDYRNNPTWGNAGWLAADVLSAGLPFIPAIGIVRHASKIDNLIDAEKTVNQVVDAEKAAEKVGDAGEAAGTARPGRLGGPEHRGKVAERASELQSQGHTIEGGGGIRKEQPVRDPVTNEVVRYPDISTTDPTGKPYHENVGKTNKRGDPVKRERDALNDIEKATDKKPGYTPYDRDKPNP